MNFLPRRFMGGTHSLPSVGSPRAGVHPRLIHSSPGRRGVVLRCLESALLSSLTSHLSISPAADNKDKLQTMSGLRVLQAGVGSVSDCVAGRLAGSGGVSPPWGARRRPAGRRAGPPVGAGCLRVVRGLCDAVWLPSKLCSMSR